MASWTSRLLARFRQPDAIRAQVFAYLFIGRIHNLVKSSYEDYLAAPSKFYGHNLATNQRPELEDGVGDSFRRAPRRSHTSKLMVASREPEDTTTVPSVPTSGGVRRRPARGGSDVDWRGRAGQCSWKSLVHKQNGTRGPGDEDEGQHEWDWRGFPELWTPFKLYDLVTTVWMIWAVIRTLFLRQLEDLISPATQHLFGMPGNCFLPGRLALPLGISPLATIVLSSYQLTWRLVQRFTKHNRLISMVVFLLASERDLGRFYAILEANKGRPRGCMPGSGVTNSTTSSSAATVKRLGAQSNERLLLETMCYPVYQSNQAYYFKLRLNRTPEARAKLVRRVTLTSFNVFIAYVITSGPLIICAMLTIYSDCRYAHVYRGCYPPLEELRARAQLDYFTWSILNDHHLLSGLIFDALENIFIWAESGYSIIFVPVFAYLLNYDLLLYWSGLEVKLERLLERAKYQYLVREERNAQQQVASFYDNMVSRRHHTLNGNKCNDPFDGHHGSLRYLDHLQMDEEASRRLETDIHEVQFEVCDFFDQMKRADGLVGDTLTAAILIWLSGCAFVSCNQLLYNTDPIALIVAFILALGFFVISLATFHLLELRRCCLKSHRVLCSLMAYDQSSCKRTFIKLVEYYTTNRTNYHILRAYPYKPTTFVTIVGWSFSCFFIAYSLFGPQQI